MGNSQWETHTVIQNGSKNAVQGKGRKRARECEGRVREGTESN